MRILSIAILTGLLAFPSLCLAQVGGNVSYSQNGGKGRAVQNERSKRTLTKEEMPSSGTSTFVEANVLMNVRADEYVAIFGIVQEGETIAECGRKMDTTVKLFSDELKMLGIADDARFVDFIAQNKIFGFEVTGDIAREKLVGFELKKNISIHYKDASLLDRIVLAASRSQVFDLIKVAYIVADLERIQDRLMDEATRIINARRVDMRSSLTSSSSRRRRSSLKNPRFIIPPTCMTPIRPSRPSTSAYPRIANGSRPRLFARAGRSTSMASMPTVSTP